MAAKRGAGRAGKHQAQRAAKQAVPPKRKSRPSSPASTPSAISGPDSGFLQTAHRLFSQGRYAEALGFFDEAVRRQPTDIRTLVDSARAHGFRYNYPRAVQLVEQLLHQFGEQAEVQHLAGETYRMLRLPEKAVPCFERACHLSPNIAMAQFELATLYERSHNLEEAHQLALKLTQKHPELEGVPVLLARILRRQKKPDQAETILRTLLRSQPKNPLAEAEAWGELAELLDSQGAYDDAWSAILDCKKVLLLRDARERQAAEFVFGRFARMVEAIRAEDLLRWQEFSQQIEPVRVALLTGFPRSGTTLLEQVLDAHPQLVSSEERELFSAEIFPRLGQGLSPQTEVVEVLDRLSPQKLLGERAHYLKTMEGMLGQQIGDRVHLDKNPAMNLMLPAVLRVFPEMKILLAIRDPRDVVLSCFLRYLSLNPVSVWFLTLQRTVQRYTLDMRAWLKFREMLLIPWAEFRYEDLVDDLEAATRRALNLLELPWDEDVMGYRQRVTQKHVFSPTYEAVAQPVTQKAIGRWRNYQHHLEPVLEQLEPFVKEFGYR